MTTRIKIFICFLVGIVSLFCLVWLFFPKGNTDIPQGGKTTATAIIDVKNKELSTVAYVPKTSRHDNDVEITKKPLKVAINGKVHELPADKVKESTRLENGKLVISQEQVISLAVPEQPRFKKGLYVEQVIEPTRDTKLGARLSYQSKQLDIDLKSDLYAKHERKTTLTISKWF